MRSRSKKAASVRVCLPLRAEGKRRVRCTLKVILAAFVRVPMVDGAKQQM